MSEEFVFLVIMWGMGILLASPLLYLVWASILSIYAYIFDLKPRCHECFRKIIQDGFGFSPKFECICGVRGVVDISWFWLNKVEDWVSPENSAEVKSPWR